MQKLMMDRLERMRLAIDQGLEGIQCHSVDVDLFDVLGLKDPGEALSRVVCSELLADTEMESYGDLQYNLVTRHSDTDSRLIYQILSYASR